MHAGTYTSQLAEMVPPSTFYAQLEQYQKESKSTDVFVLNVSDLLPVLMAAELIMRYCWSRAEFERAPSLAVILRARRSIRQVARASGDVVRKAPQHHHHHYLTHCSGGP